MRKFRFSSFATVALLVSTPASALSYTMIEIPTAGDALASGINNRGDVVGTGSIGFLYDHGSRSVSDLQYASDTGSMANGISDGGLIAGCAFAPNPPEAVLWSRLGGAQALQALYYDCANAVNNGGLVVGETAGAGFGMGAALWTGPQHTGVRLPGLVCIHCVRQSSGATAVNSRGYIVGFSIYETELTRGSHAVAWRDGQITDLGALNEFAASVAYGVNDRGEVVGRSGLGAGLSSHAFLYRRGAMTDLGTLPPDTDSSALAIDNKRDIVGWSGDYTMTSTRAFIYRDGKMHDLNELMAPTSVLEGAAHLDEAVAINSRGWIAANGTRDSHKRAYLLIPVGTN